MPTMKEILGNAMRFVQPRAPKKANVPAPKKDAICAEMLVMYEWLLKHKCKAPFFCLMLQEELDTSFLLNPEGEPAVFFDWDIVEKERTDMGNPNVWILEIEGVPN